MKRTVQMAKCTTPSKMQKIKFTEFRGVGSPQRRQMFILAEGHTNNWRHGEIPFIADYRKNKDE